MKTIKCFEITGMRLSGFKCYQEPTQLDFGNPTVVTGGNGRGKTSIADAMLSGMIMKTDFLQPYIRY